MDLFSYDKMCTTFKEFVNEKNNNPLNEAKKNKKDEFYTQLSDIEKECKFYKNFFKGKVVYCNCDDARVSNFFKYFSNNFEFLGLKKLICTGYKKGNHGVALIYEGDKNGNKIVVDDEIKVQELNGDGDFRSEECIEFLKECDVVVTNPPFSLFREYIAQLFQYNKLFLILGNMNAVKYKDIFPLIMNNKMWLGIISNVTLSFSLPDDYEKFYKIENNIKYGKVHAISWFTNIENNKQHEFIKLYKEYNQEEYPKYDNYDAINVNKTSEIPCDYDGVMGVPITFLCYYNPEQFEILGEFNHGNDSSFDLAKPVINGKELYPRIAIRRK